MNCFIVLARGLSAPKADLASCKAIGPDLCHRHKAQPRSGMPNARGDITHLSTLCEEIHALLHVLKCCMQAREERLGCKHGGSQVSR